MISFVSLDSSVITVIVTLAEHFLGLVGLTGLVSGRGQIDEVRGRGVSKSVTSCCFYSHAGRVSQDGYVRDKKGEGREN